MNDILLKYNSLPPNVQEEVNDFLDFMISKHSGVKQFNFQNWKRKILNISTWTEEDVNILQEEIEQYGKWKSEEW